MIKKALPLILFVMIIFMTPAYSGAVTIDQSPNNIWSALVHYEYKDFQNSVRLHSISGAEGHSGPYFMFDIVIKTGGELTSYDDIISVRARHTGTHRVYPLQSVNFYWMGELFHGWDLYLWPQDWMYKQKWQIVLDYLDSNGEQHRQIWEGQATPAFPAKISNVNVTRSDDSFIVSWSGIGDPTAQPSIDYRVRVIKNYKENGAIENPGSFIEDYIGDWHGYSESSVTGTYDPVLNKVTFSVPLSYAGNPYCIRLENRLCGSRSVCYMVLP